MTDHSGAARLPAGAVLHALTFVVAFCSFAYELVYAELLTVVFGGTVTQYGLTVGLFFSSLGAGSFLARALDEERPANFLRVEFLLALVGPLGFLGILLVTAGDVGLPQGVVAVLARLPVVAVGLLSGFELPLLTALVERTAAAPGPRTRLGRAVAGLRSWLWAVGYRATGLLFHVSSEGDAVDEYSTVLGMDYLGGLAGALLYVFLLYPRLGLVPTVFVLGFLNALAALVFVARFSAWSPLAGDGRATAEDGTAPAGVDPDASPDGGRPRLRSEEARALVLACLLLTASYAGILLAADRVEAEVESYYFASRIEAEYPDGTVDATVSAVERTRYQRVVRYERTWTGSGPNPHFTNRTEECLRLGWAVQLCESWARPYHHGLVDVPMSAYANGSETEVLVLGGGDWIAVDHLREYGVTVDQVDLDREFMQRTRDRAFYRQYHDDAHEYDRLNTTVADAWRYLGETNETYDLILLDLPGAEDDALLRLYSVEFYERLRDHLEPGGVVGTWTYSRYGHARHHAAYTETVRAAGFDHRLRYAAWGDVDEDGAAERVERFVLLSPDPGPALDPDANAYVRRHADRYRDREWERTPSYRGVRPNRVLHPNYDVLVRPRLDADRRADRRDGGWWPW